MIRQIPVHDPANRPSLVKHLGCSSDCAPPYQSPKLLIKYRELVENIWRTEGTLEKKNWRKKLHSGTSHSSQALWIPASYFKIDILVFLFANKDIIKRYNRKEKCLHIIIICIKSIKYITIIWDRNSSFLPPSFHGKVWGSLLGYRSSIPWLVGRGGLSPDLLSQLYCGVRWVKTAGQSRLPPVPQAASAFLPSLPMSIKGLLSRIFSLLCIQQGH